MTDSEPLRHSHYPLTQLRDLAVPATRDRILEGAARQLRHAKGDVANAIRQGLRNAIPGFRDPLRAPLLRLARELNHFLFVRAVWTRELLGLWMESVDGLAERVEAWLDILSKEGESERLLATPAGEWTEAALLGLADVNADRFPGLDRTEVAIIIGHRLWELADSSEEDESDEAADEEEHEGDSLAETRAAASEHPAEADGSGEALLRSLEDLLDPLPPTVSLNASRTDLSALQKAGSPSLTTRFRWPPLPPEARGANRLAGPGNRRGGGPLGKRLIPSDSRQRGSS